MRGSRDDAEADAPGREAILTRAEGSLHGVRADPSRPWTWSAPLLALGRTPVRLHASFLALVLLQALRVIRPGPSGPIPDAMAPMIVSLVTLAWLALLADSVREWASRRSGAAAGAIVIWPAGGLSWREPHGPWSTRLAVSLAAPVASVCVSVALGIALMVHGDRWDLALPSPWSMAGLEQLAGDRLWSTLWLVQWTNVALLAASMIPAHPFAGGRIVAASLEPWLGRDGALRASVVAGILAGALLAIAGLAFGSLLSILCGAAAIGVGMSSGHRLGIQPGMSGLGLWTMITSDAAANSHARAAIRAQRQAEADDAALDAVLEKVARQGVDALTRQERAVLSRSTARRRAEPRGPGSADGGPSGDRARGAGSDEGDSAAT